MPGSKPLSRAYPPALLESWKEGVGEFNSGRYWEAHERWERGWKELPEPDRSWVQGWIQLAGVLCLIQKGRTVAARALSARALSKLEGAKAMGAVLPRLEIEGGPAFLNLNSEEARKLLKAKLLPGTVM